MDTLPPSRQGWVEVICALLQESHTISDMMTTCCALWLGDGERGGAGQLATPTAGEDP